MWFFTRWQASFWEHGNSNYGSINRQFFYNANQGLKLFLGSIFLN